MRKTILTTVMAFSLCVTAVWAKSSVTINSVNEAVLMVKADEISSFCKAIIQGDIDMVKRLIALGEDVNKKSLGKTPAIFAARYNKTEILKLLIANGADLKIKCDKGFNAKKHAELSNAKEALEIINVSLKS